MHVAESPRDRQRREPGPGPGPIIAVFLWALFFRLVYLSEIASNPFFDTPRVTLPYTGPLYPRFLLAVSQAAGAGYFSPRLVQAFLGSVTASLVYLVARRTHGALAGLIAGVLAGASAMLIYFDGEIL